MHVVYVEELNDEGAKEQRRAILASVKLGEGWFRCSIHFVQFQAVL